MKEKFETMGYELCLAGNIPGFYTDVDSGRPGPKLCIMAELDALIAEHASDYQKLMEIESEKEAISLQLEEQYEKWEELSSLL